MADWLKQLLGGSKPAKAPVTLRRFSPADATISRDSIEVEGEGWVIDARASQVVRLFEIAPADSERCLLTYRATMKSRDLTGRAFLEMWCRLPGKGEFFSRGLNQTVQGTTDWASYQIPFRLKKDQRPDLIKLNLVVEGYGKIWIKNPELLKTPL
ncbi:MAG: hypothetical protein LLG45_02790 [Actinomycetia bacterium]|nr:hypothetical protein [Actinomycetes bacterium]